MIPEGGVIAMNERFALSVEAPAVKEIFQVEQLTYRYLPQPNIEPIAPVPAVFSSPHGRTLDKFRWGLFPFWAKDSILADGHDVYYKRAFDRILKKQRCVIPCSGFYGWKESASKNRLPEPFKFKLRDRHVFGLAGLYDEWITPRGERIRTCTIITTPVNRLTAEYMNCMPLVLEDDMIDTWLDFGMQDKRRLKSMFLPISEWKLEAEFAEDLAVLEENKRNRASTNWLVFRIKRQRSS
jgi:putative SOS response-associated peptidase YedK